jgi:cytochrome c-type biogenesis protein CcmH
MKNAIALFVCVLLSTLGVWAAEAPSVAEDPALEKRVQALTEELRCLVCQNQSLADSHAELAIDLKNQVRDKMKQGMTNEQIVEYMVARYGDFVLYRPPMKATTLFLWFGPLLLLVIGLSALFYRLSRRRGTLAPAELSESDRVRAAALLGTKDAGETR